MNISVNNSKKYPVLLITVKDFYSIERMQGVMTYAFFSQLYILILVYNLDYIL
jgi:hypothetical protein